MVSSLKIHEDPWSKGFLSLNQVPKILKVEKPLLFMSFPLIRQAVKDEALKVQVIGNQMRVTRESFDTFIKAVEEGYYIPSSNPSKAYWAKPLPTETDFSYMDRS